jgi:hypothetical protein
MLHMKRVQLQLTDAQVRELQARAMATDRPVAALVRDAVDVWLVTNLRRTQIDRALAAVGAFHSGLGDLAESHDRYLDEEIG